MSAVLEVISSSRDDVEVKSINGYAVSMGYLSMAIKGLGFLVLTWTTVVLLGGFVSILHKKDFWSLTFITLAQTAGIFDADMNEKLGYMKNAYIGLLRAINLTLLSIFREVGDCYIVLAIILMFVQATTLVMILLPLSIIYVFGLFMSGLISLWRLIKHDYRGNSDGEASNLAPAMDTLYYLALLQCVLLCYRYVLGRMGKKLCKYIAGENQEVEVVLQDYMRETKRGCEKNPAFVEGRNLITYAVDKISSNSSIDCISGVKTMHSAICMSNTRSEGDRISSNSSIDCISGVKTMHSAICMSNTRSEGVQMDQMKRLFLSTSSSQYALQKLLEMLDSRDLHEEKTISQVVTIVKRFALDINLEQFPRGIQHIFSLLQMSELGETYKKLFLQGLSILQDLAADEKNYRVMSDSRDLVSKIMAPITYDLLDHTTDDHGTWYEVVHRSMGVMSQLTGAQGESGAKLRHEILCFPEAAGTLRRILSCKKCEPRLQQRAISVLTRLYVDTTGISGSADFDLLKKENSYCREDFVRMLVNIFTHSKEYSSSIRGYAGEALSEICFLGGISDATIVIQTSGDVVDSLTQVLLDKEENKTCRQAAAEILECLCTHYTKDDEYLGKLKKAIFKVVGKILCCGDGTHNGKDIESQCDGTEENNELDKEGEGFQVDALSIMSPDLLSSLLSLCGTIYDMWLIIDLHPQLDESIFLNKLKEILEKKNNPTIRNLELCKATGKMVISMLKCCSGGFFKQEDFKSIIEALSASSKNMLDLEYSICSSASSSKKGSKLDKCTLRSLVREAKELLAGVPSTSSSG